MYTIALERPAEALRESLATYFASLTTADPALAVTPTSGNAVTVEEKLAAANITATTAGESAAVATAQTNYAAAVAAVTTALQGNPLGEGIEGLQLEAAVRNVLTSLSLPTDAAVFQATTPPPGEAGGNAGYDMVTMNFGDFLGLYVAACQLVRARAFIQPAFTVNGK